MIYGTLPHELVCSHAVPVEGGCRHITYMQTEENTRDKSTLDHSRPHGAILDLADSKIVWNVQSEYMRL